MSSLVGLQAAGQIVVSTTGPLTVRENVSSRKNGVGNDVTLTAIDAANSGQNLLVTNQAQVDGQNVTLHAGDDLRVDPDAVVNGDATVTLRGDYGNADAGVGTRIDLDGHVSGTDVFVYGATDDDVVDIHVQSLAGHTRVLGNDGEDLILVDQLPSLDKANVGQADRDTLDLDGQADTDTYIVNVTGGDTDYRINVFDTGLTGDDTLTLNATEEADNLLLRASKHDFSDGVAFVAALHSDPVVDVERVNYNKALEHLVVEAHGGDDVISIDDNWTETVVRGGVGADRFQVGQIFKTERDAVSAQIAGEDEFSTVLTTRGYLSNGVSYVTSLEGEAGDDTFTVFRNVAELNLLGGANDDLFIVRSFAEEGSSDSAIDAGDGEDTVEYVMNAAVNVNGGTGIDTLRMIGTEFSDKYVITADGIFGAGRTVNYEQIENLQIDGAEGDDEFFILSTGAGIVTSVFGGLGSDTFHIAGDTKDVVAGEVNKPAESGSHTASSIQGQLIIDGFSGDGSAGGLGEPVMLPGETNQLISTGGVVGYVGTGEGLSVDTLTVDTADLAAFVSDDENLNTLSDLVGRTLEISLGSGSGRFWQIVGVSENGGTTDLSLQSPTLPAAEWGLPDGNSKYAITKLSANFFVNEDTALDRVTVFSDGSTTNDNGVLTATTLTGLGMVAEGVTYANFEAVEVLLGTGDDTFTVDGTADGAITAIHGGGGDTITVNDRGGLDARGLDAPLAIFGDTTQDGSRYAGNSDTVSAGDGWVFDNAGNDTIDAATSTQNVAIYGGSGNDVIHGSQAGDQLAGGSGDDEIYGEAGSDHIYGDSGFNLDLASRDLTVPTRDAALAQSGDGLVAGSDDLYGDAGDDIISGDHGVITQTNGTSRILDTGAVERIETAEPVNGAADFIQGGLDNDRILGGNGGDEIEGNAGADVVIGDLGRIDYNTGDDDLMTLDQVVSSDVSTGGNDVITTHDDSDVVIAGVGSDTVTAGDGDNIVIGDNGQINYKNGILESVVSTAPNDGGNDQVTTGANDDIVIAGIGSDTVTAGNGNNIVIGDNGSIHFDGVDGNALTLDSVVSTAPTVGGGDDAITTGSGNDIIVGGDNAGVVDEKIAGGEGDNIVLGDNGQVIFHTGQLDLIESSEPGQGGRDVITTGAGQDTIVAGFGSDQVAADDGDNIVLGDNGEIDYTTGSGVLESLVSTSPGDGGGDQITTGADSDIVIAGIGGDTVTAGNGDNIVVGDNGSIRFNGADGNPATLDEVKSTAPTSGGGDDKVTTGVGNDLVIGGLGGDIITVDDGDNVVLGDNGSVTMFGGLYWTPETGPLIKLDTK